MDASTTSINISMLDMFSMLVCYLEFDLQQFFPTLPLKSYQLYFIIFTSMDV